MTGLDSNPASATITPPASPAGLPLAVPAAPAQEVAARLPRDPRARLAALFDPGTLELLPAEGEERSGVLAGVGLVQGAGVVAFASDPRVQGGAMGTAGCAAIVGAFSPRAWGWSVCSMTTCFCGRVFTTCVGMVRN